VLLPVAVAREPHGGIMLAYRTLAVAAAVSATAVVVTAAAAWSQAAPAPKTSLARVLVLQRPDSAGAVAFPDATWTEVSGVAPGLRAGIRVEVNTGDTSTVSRWLDSTDLQLLRAGTRLGTDSVRLSRAFLRNAMCVSARCLQGGVVAFFGDLGIVPDADTVELIVSVPDAVGRSRTVYPIWVRRSSRFTLGGSFGATLPLNSASGRDVVPRLGMNGRVLVATLKPGWLFHRRWLMTGPFLLEGDYLLGLAALQHDSTAADSAETFRKSSEGAVRFEWPLVDFGADVTLRAVWQGGFVTVQNLPNYWVQEYKGFRLGMDAADISGRQSFVELTWGHSDNLRPSSHRWRVVVQLLVPRTQLVFQFGVNYARGQHRDPSTSDSPVILSVFTTQDFQFLYGLLTGKGTPPSP
jgi:hypothetical protein